MDPTTLATLTDAASRLGADLADRRPGLIDPLGDGPGATTPQALFADLGLPLGVGPDDYRALTAAFVQGYRDVDAFGDRAH